MDKFQEIENTINFIGFENKKLFYLFKQIFKYLI